MKELFLDMKNYGEGTSVFKRTAVRGIVMREGKYLTIYSKHGDYKFPGGGREEGETLQETLVREMQEETGYHVIIDSIKEGILVHERRKGEYEDILEMDSYYFFCQVEQEAGERNLDEYEEEYDYQVAWLPLEEIIHKNQEVEDYENIPWILRENMVMKEIISNL